MDVLSRLLNRLSLKSFPGKSAICFYTISWGWLFYIRDSIWSDDWDLFAFRRFTTLNFDDFGIAPWREIDLLIIRILWSTVTKSIDFFMLPICISLCTWNNSKNVEFVFVAATSNCPTVFSSTFQFCTNFSDGS